jgi:hypothetical protein
MTKLKLAFPSQDRSFVTMPTPAEKAARKIAPRLSLLTH